MLSPSDSKKDDNKSKEKTPPKKDSEPTIHATEEVSEDSTQEPELKYAGTLESTKGANESRKLWVDVITGNRNPGNGMTLEFIAPNIIDGVAEVVIEEADIIDEVRFLDTALIMYVIGGDLSMNVVKQFMLKYWNFVKLPDMYYNNEGYFVLRFNSHQDRDVVMMKGPYMIRNMPMLLVEWKPNFNLKKDMMRTIPVWIQLPQPPLHLWGAKNMGKIASVLGKPLMTDECTANRYRISYARILIEIDITQELQKEITIIDEKGEKMQQPVEYE